VLLVHGLFVNADHWRRNLPALAAAGYRTYAIDLLGYGYSSKPNPYGDVAQKVNGENTRQLEEPEVELGTADGGQRTASVPLQHPLGSAYNFYTWSEQLRDFVREVVRTDGTTLVSNSIGTIASLQAAVDEPALFNGVVTVNPNFRELHAAEMPPLIKPAVEAVQWALREYGKPVFDALANKDSVKQILKEPYHDPSQVTDELVEVLLKPLLTEGSAEVVFDTLSYSAGPLPEQLLNDPRLKAPVWVCYGEKDPWTPNARVRALDRFDAVRRVVPIRGAGHCPHDEAPEIVNPLLVEFLTEASS
jgi:pimeloyl-ACP methyl ester carboxylesterase